MGRRKRHKKTQQTGTRGSTENPASEIGSRTGLEGERGSPHDLRRGEPQGLCRRRQTGRRDVPQPGLAERHCQGGLRRGAAVVVASGNGRAWIRQGGGRAGGELRKVDIETARIPGRRSGEHPERQPANRSQNRTTTRPGTHAISGTNGVDAGLDTAAFGGRRAFAGGWKRRRTSGTW